MIGGFRLSLALPHDRLRRDPQIGHDPYAQRKVFGSLLGGYRATPGRIDVQPVERRECGSARPISG